jgi:predicted enzyme related to lactoylglutathione lyase
MSLALLHKETLESESMPRIAHFAIPADDPERAMKFYSDVFGWRFEVGWEYDTPSGREKNWTVDTTNLNEPGIDGWLTRREFPGQPISVGIEVSEIETFFGKIEQSGGRVIVRKTPLPNGNWFGVCQDPEGNTFVISQRDKLSQDSR